MKEISQGYWWFDIASYTFNHLRVGAEIIPGEHQNLEDIDIVIPMNQAKTFIAHILESFPELISVYKGRDKEDIKIINRLIDVIEKKKE